MIECNCMIPVMNYGSSASYKAEPSPEQIATGVIPLDSLPAAWWNCMWSQTNTAVNQARQELGQLIVELNNVLCNAGVCPQDVCTDQLYQSIEKIRQTLGNATTAGAVKSSSQPSEVAIDQTTGMMSVNCLGNAASLTTSARTVVGAVNELKSTYDQCFTDTGTALSGKAPTSHVSDLTTYGVGNADCYGHLKISDQYTSVLAACEGVAASQLAVACVYDFAAGIAEGVASLGNTAGCALGTASAGTAVTAARSDHVHPVPDTFGQTITLGTGSATQSAGIIRAHGYQAAYSMICFLNNTTDTYGNGYSIGGGGVGILGAGEGAESLWTWLNGSANLYGTAAGCETLYLASDGEICFFTNTQSGAASACKTRISTNGYFYGNVCGNVCGYATGAAAVASYTNILCYYRCVSGTGSCCCCYPWCLRNMCNFPVLVAVTRAQYDLLSRCVNCGYQALVNYIIPANCTIFIHCYPGNFRCNPVYLNGIRLY